MSGIPGRRVTLGDVTTTGTGTIPASSLHVSRAPSSKRLSSISAFGGWDKAGTLARVSSATGTTNTITDTTNSRHRPSTATSKSDKSTGMPMHTAAPLHSTACRRPRRPGHKREATEDAGFAQIRGPILNQLQVHFVLSGLLLVLTHYTEFAFVWLWALPLYVFTSFAVIEVSRLLLFRDPKSMLPLYLSFLPYIIFHVLARQAALFLGVFWFISIMNINIQMGGRTLNFPVLIACATFVVLYLGLLLLQSRAFQPSRGNDTSALFASTLYTTRDVPCSDADAYVYRAGNATLGTPDQCKRQLPLAISYTALWTFLTALMMLCASLYTLQRHIREYAHNLRNSSDEMRLLARQNDKLKHQLDAIRPQLNLDLDSPITKIIKRIRRLQESHDLEAEQMESLDYVVQILSSNQLFMPNLNVDQGAMDAEVNKFLTSMINNDTEVGASTVPSSTTPDPAVAAPNASGPMILPLPGKRGSNIPPLSPMPGAVLAPGSSSSDAAAPISVLPGPDPGPMPIPATIVIPHSSERVEELLLNLNSWDFDVFALAEESGGRPLFNLGLAIFSKYDFAQAIGTPTAVMACFLSKVEAGYRKNPYHNSTHAADVMHAMHFYLEVLGLNKIVSTEDCFTGLVASAIHDLDHPGVNNAFLINTYDPLAIRYNDTAVLESYHCSRAFEIMETEESCNILQHLPLDKYKQLRSAIVQTVLATDMSSHFEFISKFTNKVNGSGFNPLDPKDRQLAMDIAIKCGDISNGTKNLTLCKRWAGLIMEEFFLQGDQERAKNLPVSTFMDRATTIIPKCQVGFLDYIVTPLFEAWNMFMNEDGSFEGMSNLIANREYWKSAPENFELASVLVQQDP